MCYFVHPNLGKTLSTLNLIVCVVRQNEPRSVYTLYRNMWKMCVAVIHSVHACGQKWFVFADYSRSVTNERVRPYAVGQKTFVLFGGKKVLCISTFLCTNRKIHIKTAWKPTLMTGTSNMLKLACWTCFVVLDRLPSIVWIHFEWLRCISNVIPEA